MRSSSRDSRVAQADNQDRNKDERGAKRCVFHLMSAIGSWKHEWSLFMPQRVQSDLTSIPYRRTLKNHGKKILKRTVETTNCQSPIHCDGVGVRRF
jgi:hypothetical protein